MNLSAIQLSPVVESQPPSARYTPKPQRREAIDTILDLGLRYLGMQSATYCEVVGGALVVVAERKAEGGLGAPFFAPPGLATGDSIWVDDVEESSGPTSSRLRQLGVETYVGAPVDVDGERVGVIEFAGRRRPLPFVDSDVEMVELLGRWLGTELECENV